jgi:hypothetical protein
MKFTSYILGLRPEIGFRITKSAHVTGEQSAATKIVLNISIHGGTLLFGS